MMVSRAVYAYCQLDEALWHRRAKKLWRFLLAPYILSCNSRAYFGMTRIRSSMGQTAYRLPFPHPKVVSKILGHASITMTLDRYSHWIPSIGRHAAEGMDEALG